MVFGNLLKDFKRKSRFPKAKKRSKKLVQIKISAYSPHNSVEWYLIMIKESSKIEKMPSI
jgi:hypothetical protein